MVVVGKKNSRIESSKKVAKINQLRILKILIFDSLGESLTQISIITILSAVGINFFFLLYSLKTINKSNPGYGVCAKIEGDSTGSGRAQHPL